MIEGLRKVSGLLVESSKGGAEGLFMKRCSETDWKMLRVSCCAIWKGFVRGGRGRGRREEQNVQCQMTKAQGSSNDQNRWVTWGCRFVPLRVGCRIGGAERGKRLAGSVGGGRTRLNSLKLARTLILNFFLFQVRRKSTAREGFVGLVRWLESKWRGENQASLRLVTPCYA